VRPEIPPPRITTVGLFAGLTLGISGNCTLVSGTKPRAVLALRTAAVAPVLPIKPSNSRLDTNFFIIHLLTEKIDRNLILNKAFVVPIECGF
jgi:hypothetical protein